MELFFVRQKFYLGLIAVLQAIFCYTRLDYKNAHLLN